jgi:hypothetical protein
MNELIRIFQIKLLTTCSDVSLFIPPKFVLGPQNPYSNIEFSIVVQKRFDVYLDDK